MSLFTSLFSLKAPEKKAPSQPETIVLVGGARYEVEIVGAERYQPALEAICGPRQSKGIRRFETARLILEDKNPQDRSAVQVEIRCRTVGYLGPEQALSYRQLLVKRDAPRAAGQCQALISGGWFSSDGRKGPYEVCLDLPSL
jgi:hypothetical protein